MNSKCACPQQCDDPQPLDWLWAVKDALSSGCIPPESQLKAGLKNRAAPITAAVGGGCLPPALGAPRRRPVGRRVQVASWQARFRIFRMSARGQN